MDKAAFMMRNNVGRGIVLNRPLPWILAVIALAGCIGTETTNPNETETGNPVPGLSGHLVDASGAPVEGATVKAFPEDRSGVEGASAGGVLDSALTDAKGRYRFPALTAGSYNLIGEYGRRNLAVLIPRIPYQGRKISLDLGIDTLRAPGQIQGSVTLAGKPRDGVFCYLPGTSFLSISDDNGGFWIANVPAGRYSVKYAQTGLATAVDTAVVVSAGSITKLKPKEMAPDTAFPPPPPDSLWLEQDTAAGTVKVRWTKAMAGDVDGYWVYRNEAGADEPVRVSPLVRDTFFVDTVFRGPEDTVKRELVYRVKTQDRQALLSATYGPTRTLSAEPPYLQRPLVVWTLPDTVSPGDKIRIIADFRLGAGVIDSIQWDSDWNEPNAKPFRKKRIGAAEGLDTLEIVADEVWPKRNDPVRPHAPILSLFDGHRRRWREVTNFQVIADAPQAFAGNDTTVAIDSFFTLRGRGQDRFGHIIAYFWDLDGDGIFENGSKMTGDLLIKFATGGRKTITLSVTDDDQRTGTDVVIVDVGSLLDMDSLARDTVLKKSGNPYWIKRPLLVPEGRKLEMEAGTDVRFWPKAGLIVKGTLVAKGAPGDSVRFSSEGGWHFSPPGTQYGLQILGGDDPNPARDTASSLAYVSFQDSKIGMVNSRPRIENSTFRAGVSDPMFAADAELAFYSSGRNRGEWICRNNVFTGFAVRVDCDSLGHPPSGPASPHRMVRFENNRLSGPVGIQVVNSNRDSASMEFLGNELRISTQSGYDRAGFSLRNASRVRLSGNRVSGANQAVSVYFGSVAEIDHNDFSGNEAAFLASGIIGADFNEEYTGRFHHNAISGSSEAAFLFKVHSGGVFDSNVVAADAGTAFVKDGYTKGTSTLGSAKDIDLRGNHWIMAGAIMDAAGVKGNLHVSQAAMDAELGNILIEPVLAQPPAGAGPP
jgi:hypothetical protein